MRIKVENNEMGFIIYIIKNVRCMMKKKKEWKEY